MTNKCNTTGSWVGFWNRKNISGKTGAIQPQSMA